MSNVLLLNGSARRGNSLFLSKQLQDILTENGMESSILHIHEYDIKPCKGCFWCYKGFPLRCVQDDDDMNRLYPQVMEADTIVFVSPIYWFNYSGQLKLFIDRLVALHIEGGHKLDRKGFAAVFVYGDKDVEESGVNHAIASIKHLVRYLKGELIGIIHGTANDRGDAEKNVRLVSDVQELATKIIQM